MTEWLLCTVSRAWCRVAGHRWSPSAGRTELQVCTRRACHGDPWAYRVIPSREQL